MNNISIFKNLSFYTILVFFALFPFFEGGENAVGLFVFHSLVLIAFFLVILAFSRFWIPRFLLYFLPFILALCASTAIAPYKYAAVLLLWDYVIAGVYAIVLFSVLHENRERLSRLTFLAFLIGSAGILVSLLLKTQHYRITGTFVNPNDFAALALLMMILGIFQFEHESARNHKILIAVLLVLLSVCMSLAASRSVFVAALVFCVLYIWNRRPSKGLTIGISIALLVGIALIYFRFSYFSDPYQYVRLRIWKHSLKGVLEDPYLGIGLNMLPYRAAKLNFPADGELGRYSRIAKSADNQYFQILTETGFLGFLTFLVGWIAIYLALRRTPSRFFCFRYCFFAVSIIALFSLPLNNTSVLFTFLFLILFAVSLDPNTKPICISFQAVGKIALGLAAGTMFTFFVLLPFVADREFKTAMSSVDGIAAERHLQKAILYNPYQPYYRFFPISKIITSSQELTTSQGLSLVDALNVAIRLNPLESDFPAYKAKVYRILFKKNGDPSDFQAAVISYQSAIGLSPYNVFLRAEYAFFLTQNGRLEPAIDELSKMIEIEPAYLNARYLLARTQYQLGDQENARKSLAEADRYYERYKNYQLPDTEAYTRGLLHINPEIRQEVRDVVSNVR